MIYLLLWYDNRKSKYVIIDRVYNEDLYNNWHNIDQEQFVYYVPKKLKNGGIKLDVFNKHKHKVTVVDDSNKLEFADLLI